MSDKTELTDEFWAIEYQYFTNDVYWGSSGKIYDEKKANSVYDELKNKYPVIKLVHSITRQEVIKSISSTKE